MSQELTASDLMRFGTLERSFLNAGFSKRTAVALATLRVSGPEELRTLPWGDYRERTGLVWELARLPNMGRKGLSEVIAFREHGDPRQANEVGGTSVTVRLAPDAAKRLDEWARRAGVSRSQAMRQLMMDGLQRAGVD